MANIAISNVAHVRPLEGALTVSKTAGEAMAQGKWVYIGSDGRVYQTDAADAAKSSGIVGLVVSSAIHAGTTTIAEGDQVDVVLFGRVAFPATTPALTPTAQYFLANVTSTVLGLMADAAGTVTRRVGRAENANIFFVNPDIAPATS